MKIIFAIIVKEFLQLRRDPRLFGIIFIAPVDDLTFEVNKYDENLTSKVSMENI